jgi:hypothetical protein
MVSKATLSLIAAGGLSLVAFGQNLVQNLIKTAPIPADPLEIVHGQIQTVESAANRETVLQLLNRARKSYALRAAGQPFDLKVTFSVDSGGQTDYDGAWQMEDTFDPQLGLRWTANAAAGFSATQIFSKQTYYGDATGNVIPLRLQEARAALFDPIPPGNLDRIAIRTSTATFNGAQVTCVLLSAAGNNTAPSPSRRWDEIEECVDPASGLLELHSRVPGRYYAYDYSNALQLGGHMLPGKVIVTEGGKTVSEIKVVSLTNLSAADPSLFVPTAEMKAKGPAIAMGPAQDISRFYGAAPSAPGAPVQAVCVFGLVTPTGQLIEAHSLQPSDPNSQAAIDDARKITFPTRSQAGARPQQHFVFIIEKFATAQ